MNECHFSARDGLAPSSFSLHVKRFSHLRINVYASDLAVDIFVSPPHKRKHHARTQTNLRALQHSATAQLASRAYLLL